MGMAAGQARLLSITSRMSDNELRAQIINNQKMRLATESSQVSEAYVNALNQSQMMFTNYDADNNTSYQQLTFNSLTSYNPYNNQYGLVNASGQILVSEKDATNFMNANGDMDKFLSYYGLEKTTTYFDELEKYQGTATDVYGNKIMNIPIMATDEKGITNYVDSGYTASELKDMFLGLNGHSGYDTALSSSFYNSYIGYAEKFDSAYTSYAESIASSMGNILISLTSTSGVGGQNLNNITAHFGAINDHTKLDQTDIAYLNALQSIIDQVERIGSSLDNANYFDNLKTQIDGLIEQKYISTYGGDSDNASFYYNDTDTVVIDNSLRIVKKNDGGYSIDLVEPSVGGNGEVTYNQTYAITYNIIQDEYTTTIRNSDGTSRVLKYNFGDGIESVFEAAKKAAQDDSSDIKKASVIETCEMSIEEIISSVDDIINKLQTDIYNLWPVDDPSYAVINGKETQAHLDYRNAAGAFMAALIGGTYTYLNSPEETNNFSDVDKIQIIIGGDNISVSLKDITIIASDINSLAAYINGTNNDPNGDGQELPPIAENSSNLQDLLDVIVLNNVMNTYGEPKVTWIDKNDSNANGEAKYNWYSGLFERMQKGFKVLQDGLASSNEWIQFALENGIVTMEQVDSEGNWNSLNYSNCSDITEQTNDQAVAIAEAEYNAAMNKIENKDKRYDLELKNIDTEHNSLQTEYDSIKTAIDKNIERTFKIYS